MGDQEDQPDPGDLVVTMVRLLECKAKAAGVTREDYAIGIANGKYPPIEEDEWRAFVDKSGSP